MNLIKRNNYTGLNPFDYNFNSLVDRFFNDDDVLSYPTTFEKRYTNLGSVNVKELDDKIVLDFQVPGFNKNDIDISVEGNRLNICGNIEETSEENENYYRKEFKKTSFERSFIIPENVNMDDITATSKNGILTIEIRTKRKED